MPVPAFLVASRVPALAISRLTIDMTAGNVSAHVGDVSAHAGDASAHAGGKPAGRMIR